jgi:hypothetical protein
MRQAKAAERDVPTKSSGEHRGERVQPAALVLEWVWNAHMLKVAVITRQSCGL